MKEKIEKIIKFIKSDIWELKESELPPMKLRVVRFFQFISLAVAGFRKDKLNLRASALTYFTMLSIVPVLALGFGIAKGFGLEAVLEDELAKGLASQKEVLNYILSFVRSMLDTAKGGLIAGIGLVVLLWSVMKLMGNIESAFNHVWAVKKSRAWYRKFTDYMSIVIVGTILMIMSGSVSVIIATQLRAIAEGANISIVSLFFLQLAKIIPYLLSWLLFSLLYTVMPNAKVKTKSAMIAGIITSIVFGLFQLGYVEAQRYTTRINAIYGSFAALPLFLMWLQTSWFVILLGAEISFAVQNLKLKGDALEFKKFSFYYEKQIAIWIVKIVIDRFEKGEQAYTSKQISSVCKTPVYAVEKILDNLQKAKLISKIDSDDEPFYQPAESINNINIVKVMKSYEQTSGKDSCSSVKYKGFEELKTRFDKLADIQEKSEFNELLKDIDLDK